jgi:dimethylargininase
MPIQDATSPLRRVYVRPPSAGDLAAWRDYAWHAEPDAGAAADEHAKLQATLQEAGAEVVLGSPVAGDPDSLYAYDPTLLTDAGVILLHPGKEGRRGEPEVMGADLEALGIPVIGRMQAPGTAEGGDMFWLDPTTLLIGRGYRTNDDGIAQLRAMLEPSGIDVVGFDLPHFRGPGMCIHLMSFISPLDRDLAVVFPMHVPVRLMEILRMRGIAIVEVPEEEFDSQGANVLALGPRLALAVDGNPETRRRMEAAGVEVRTFSGAEISVKGDGGPTCLTRPLERG